MFLFMLIAILQFHTGAVQKGIQRKRKKDQAQDSRRDRQISAVKPLAPGPRLVKVKVRRFEAKQK